MEAMGMGTREGEMTGRLVAQSTTQNRNLPAGWEAYYYYEHTITINILLIQILLIQHSGPRLSPRLSRDVHADFTKQTHAPALATE